MKTIEQILVENEPDMIATYTGKYWGTLTVMEMMREYAKQECINFLKELREYQTDLNDGIDPLDEAMTCEEYYEIYENVQE